jgi:hypothetical protein
MTNAQDFPSLTQFLGAYFHQDWVDEFPSAEAAIAAFVSGAPTESVRSACDELRRAVLLTRQGKAPQRFLNELACYYDPTADGLTVPDWLEQVREKLECK